MAGGNQVILQARVAAVLDAQKALAAREVGAAPALRQSLVDLAANSEAVADLVARVAEELRIETPPLLNDTVALPHDTARVRAALDKVEPGWESEALISPP